MSDLNSCPQRGIRYKTKEESHRGYLNAQAKYARQRWRCDICDCEINLGNKTNHLKSNKHQTNRDIGKECPTCTARVIKMTPKMVWKRNSIILQIKKKLNSI